MIQRAVSTNVRSCEVIGHHGPGADSELTIEVIYAGSHETTNLRFSQPLRDLAHVDSSCLNDIFTNLEATGCQQVTSSYYEVNVYYSRNNFPMGSITIENSFNFAETGLYFDDSTIEVMAKDHTSWGEAAFCSPFYTTGKLLDNTLTIQKASLTYEKTDILISFTVQGSFPAFQGDMANFTFIFPDAAAFTAFTICTEESITGSTSILEKKLIFRSGEGVTAGSILKFTITNVYNPPFEDSILITITMDSNPTFYISGRVSWAPSGVGQVPYIGLKLISFEPGSYTNYTFSMDFTPYALQLGDRITIYYKDIEGKVFLFKCNGNFSISAYDPNSKYIECRYTGNNPLVTLDLNLGNCTKNPATQGLYNLDVILHINYTNSQGALFQHQEACRTDNVPYFITDNNFGSETSVRNDGSCEIEKSSRYIFTLKSPIVLESPTSIQIFFNSNQYLQTAEECTISEYITCTPEKYKITLSKTNGLTDSLTEIGISGIINPSYPYSYEDVKFNIVAWDNTNIVYSQEIQLKYEYEGKYLVYLSHSFGPESIVLPQKSTTASITSYTLTLINLDYLIPDGFKMKIILPPALRFQGTPTMEVIQGFSSPITIPYSDGSSAQATGLFKGEVAANTNMTMEITNIKNPNYFAPDERFKIRIYEPSFYNFPYFKTENELSVNIDMINDFAEFLVFLQTQMKIVSKWTRYEIRFKLRTGEMPKDSIVKLTVPPSIKFCDFASIILTRQASFTCSSNQLSDEKRHEYSPYIFGYESHLCVNAAEANIEFSIECRNPETTKPTGNFTLSVEKYSSIFYESTGSPITMNEAGTFASFSFSKAHTWLDYPTTFIFMFIRTSSNVTTDIDQIKITISSDLAYTSCPSISEITGITGNLEMSCSGGVITISSIVELLTTFSFQLSKIKTPSASDLPIYFDAETGNSDGYIGETRQASYQYAQCAYPCKECTTGISANCTACYDKDNIVFEGGTSMHILYSAGACLDSCPPHTYTLESSPDSCLECDSNCKLCDLRDTNCTSCEPNKFLHANECILDCLDGYSNNEDTWSCTLIRGYETGTYIQIVNILEVEQEAAYRFVLKPEGGLSATDAKLEIAPVNQGMGPSCPDICTVTLPVGYTPGETPIDIEIYNLFINPELTYLLSDISLNVKTKINDTVYHSGDFYIESTADSRYTPHTLGGGSHRLRSSHSRTVTLTTLTFNVTNTDFYIPTGHKIIITFPSQLAFSSGLIPVFKPLENLSMFAFTSAAYPFFTITGAFADGPLPPNSVISFSLNNILTGRILEISDSFILDIGNTSDLKQFTLTEGLTVEITRIALFPAFSVRSGSGNYVTSDTETYEFIASLGAGQLNPTDQIVFSIPPSITNCDISTLTALQGLGTTITGTSISSNKYSFEVPSYVAEKSIFKFGIDCQNPETTRQTENFNISALTSTSSIFCESSGSPLTMNEAGTFTSFSFTRFNEWLNFPTKFIFMITRTSSNVSTDIDQIKITIASDLAYISCPSISKITGITGNFGMSCSGGVITISSIVELSTTFSFQLNKIKTPSASDLPIYFDAETGNSDGYIGETGQASYQYAQCTFPCKECTTGISANCTTCYDKNNAVFDGEASMHIMYINLSSVTCLDVCPSHTYTLDSFPDTCYECHTICELCSLIDTNCTKCYPDTFLHLSTCISPGCPDGYSDNKDEWTCVLIRGYDTGTVIQIIDTLEVEQVAGYSFTLKPELYLRATEDTKLEIACSATLGVGPSCQERVCTISSFLSTDYVSGGGTPIILSLTDTYTNPALTYFLWDIIFSVKTKINDTVYHSGDFRLESSANNRYTPHTLGGGSPRLSSNYYSTVTHTTLTFNVTNIDFSIPIGYKIIITFPSQLTFSSELPPEYIPLESLAAGTFTSSYPSFAISGAFTDGPLPPNSVISFSLNNILTGRIFEISDSFILDIGNTSDLKQFTLTEGLTIEIIQIAQFPAFNVRSGYITSDFDTFEFSVTLGAGMLNTTDQIVFTVPRTVKNCNISTFTAIQGLTTAIMETNEISSNKFSFDVPCYIPDNNQFKFGIVCQHPETTKVTDNFLISAKIKNTNHIFYESSGSPMTMNILNTFSNIVMTMESEEARVMNTMNIIVTRTASYDSTDIDEIQITASNTLNMAECSVSIISGINPAIPTVNKSGQQITLGGIISLSRVFEVQLVNVQNPSEHNNIEFGILTAHSDGTQGEEDQTPALFTLCDYPCRICTSFDECASCFPPSHYVFSTGPQFYFYVHYLSQCVEECPIHYYENSTISCDRCITTCKECFGVASNCTLCYELTYLYQECLLPPCTPTASCIATCPPHYYQNENELLCLPCHDTCANCSSTLSTGCTLCYPEFLLFWNGHCAQCPSHTYFDKTEKRCFECDFRCKECLGPSNSNCIVCFPSLLIILSTQTGYCDCLLGYFSNPQTSQCRICDITCKSCNGPKETDCVTCINELMIWDPSDSLCKCPSNMHFYDELCKQCPEACLECIGQGHESCLKCNDENGYYELEESEPREDGLKSCFYLCLSPTLNLFLDDQKCKLCNLDCEICDGPSNVECSKCKPPLYLGNTHECLYPHCSNYPNTFPINNICEKCNSKCEGCSNTPDYCVACAASYFLNPETHDCVSECPKYYCPNTILQICQPCPNTCEVCERVNMNSADLDDTSEENFRCSYCKEAYFLNTESKCLPSSECGANFYGEIKTRTCNLCDKACHGCTGPDHFSCRQCTDKFVLTSMGSCELFNCNKYEYLDMDLICKKCHSRCKGCMGPSDSNCLFCFSGYFPVSTEGQQIKCTPCENITGYITTTDPITNERKCVEICGDGLNLGEYECDDGNINNRDGCSSECIVEEGYTCQGGNFTSPDICKDITSPILKATGVGKENMFYFALSEPVEIKSTKSPKTFVNLAIRGKYESYVFDYEVHFNKGRILPRKLLETAEEIYETIIITLIPLSSIIQDDILTIFFNSDILSDNNGNIMHGQEFSMILNQFKYIDPNDGNTVDSSGNTILYSMMALLTINIFISVICVSSMNTLLPLFNMIQLIVLMPLLEINLPENLRAFIRQYLQFANFKFEFLSNPFHNWGIFDLSEINNCPLNDNFEENGIHSKALIINYGGQLIIWIFIIFLYFPIALLAKCCKWKFFIQLKKSYEYAILLTSFSEAYAEFALTSFLNIYQIEFSSTTTILSTTIGLLGIVLTFGYIVLIFNILSNIGKMLEKEENLQKFGCLYSETNYKSHEKRRRIPQYITIIFLMRRFLFILIILFIYKKPILQQISNVTIHLIVFLYDMLMRPYPFNLIGILIYSFDFCLAGLFVSLPLYMIFPNHSDAIGRIHIYILIVIFGLSWVVIVGLNARTIYRQFKTPSIREQLDAFVQEYNRKNDENMELERERQRHREQQVHQIHSNKRPRMLVLTPDALYLRNRTKKIAQRKLAQS